MLAALGHAGGQGSSAYSQRAALGARPRARRRQPRGAEGDGARRHRRRGRRLRGAAAALAVAAGLRRRRGERRPAQPGAPVPLRASRTSGATSGAPTGCASPARCWPRCGAAGGRRGRGAAPVVRRAGAVGRHRARGGGRAIAAELADLVDVRHRRAGLDLHGVSATRPDGHVEPGFNLDLAAPRPRRAVGRGRCRWSPRARSSTWPWPRRRVGRRRVPTRVEMTRAQIADPDLVAKLAGGRGRTASGRASCATRRARCATPATPSCRAWSSRRRGHEGERRRRRRRGAGVAAAATCSSSAAAPAGLECARVAAPRGHRVRLVERLGRARGHGARGRRAAPGGHRLARARRLAGGRVRAPRREGGDRRRGHGRRRRGALSPAEVVLCTRLGAPAAALRRRRSAPVRSSAQPAADAARRRRPLPDGPVVGVGPDRGADRRLGRRAAGGPDGSRVTLVTPDLIAGQRALPHGRPGAGQRPPAAGRRALGRSGRCCGRSHADAVDVEDRFTGERRTDRRRRAGRRRPPPPRRPPVAATGGDAGPRRRRAWRPARSTRRCSRPAGPSSPLGNSPNQRWGTATDCGGLRRPRRPVAPGALGREERRTNASGGGA